MQVQESRHGRKLVVGKQLITFCIILVAAVLFGANNILGLPYSNLVRSDKCFLLLADISFSSVKNKPYFIAAILLHFFLYLFIFR